MSERTINEWYAYADAARAEEREACIERARLEWERRAPEFINLCQECGVHFDDIAAAIRAQV